MIRWFGARGKIFNLHFRNIRGRRLSFTEVFPDDGDMDMARTLRLYAELGYEHMVMPDHVPLIAGQDPEGSAFAYLLRLHPRPDGQHARLALTMSGRRTTHRNHHP